MRLEHDRHSAELSVKCPLLFVHLTRHMALDAYLSLEC